MSLIGLNKNHIKEYSKISDIRSIVVIFFDWIIIFISIYFAIESKNIWIGATAILIIARQQHAFGVLMHEACHFRLFTNKFINDLLGQWLLAGPVFFSLDTFRYIHLAHHKAPLNKNDPDLALTGGYPIAKDSFCRKIFRDLTGRSYFKILKSFNFKVPIPHRSKWILMSNPWISAFVVNLVLLALVSIISSPLYYLALWILPQTVLLPFILRDRGITEHAGYKPNKNQSLASRTVTNGIGRWLFAPHNVNYHIEHHMYPGITFNNLPKVHKILKKQRITPTTNISKSYYSVMKTLVKDIS